MWVNEDINNIKLDSLLLCIEVNFFVMPHCEVSVENFINKDLITHSLFGAFNKKFAQSIKEEDEESFVIRNHKNYATM